MDFQKIADAWLADDKSVLDEIGQAKLRAVGLIAAGIEDERALEAAGEDFVRGMKATSLVRQAGVVVEKAEAPRANTLTWVFSDEKPDRAGDIILQNGWQLDNYKRNPVILWGHAMGLDSEADVPIGRAENVRIEGTKLVGEIVFAVAESERAARLYKLASAGFVKAGSVGFRPLKVNHIADENERSKLGLGRFGVVFEKSELLEFSLCAVPCNAGALQQSLKSGDLNEADLDILSKLPTERDSVNAMRRRALSALGAASAGARDERDTESIGGGALSDLAAAVRSLAERQAEIVVALGELRASREEEAASRRMLARSITDLGARVGATRAADAARSVADAVAADAGDAMHKNLKKIEDLVAALGGGKS